MYGAKVQLTTPIDVTPAMSNDQTKKLQQVVGTFLFYARAVDPTMLHALNALAAAQSKGTQATVEALVHLLNYCATHPDATI
jgi:hydroxypyruvate isomerase